MESPQQTTLSTDEAQIAAEIGRKFANGDSLAQIFGVQDDFLNTCEQKAYELYLQGHFDNVTVLAQGVVALDSTRYYPYLLLGEMALQEKRWNDAVTLLQKAYSLYPREQGTVVKLGEAYIRTEQFHDAKVLLQPLTLSETIHGRRAKALLQAVYQREAIQAS